MKKGVNLLDNQKCNKIDLKYKLSIIFNIKWTLYYLKE
jgi:hypothetical protein